MYALLFQVSSVVFINITMLSHRSAKKTKKDGLQWPDLIYYPHLLRQIYIYIYAETVLSAVSYIYIYISFISFFVFFPLSSFYGFKMKKPKNRILDLIAASNV